MEAPKRNEERFIKRYLDERLSNSLEGVEVSVFKHAHDYKPGATVTP